MPNELKKCPICNFTPITINRSGDSSSTYHIKCERCGGFLISSLLLAVLEKDRTIIEQFDYILSGLSRELYEAGDELPNFQSAKLEEYTNNYLVPDVNDVKAKANKLVNYLREKSNYYGALIEVKNKNDYSLAYAKNEDEFIALIRLLEESNLVKIISPASVSTTIQLTAEGWDMANKMKKKQKDSDQAFIAIWFPDDNSNDDIINAIVEAVKSSGYKPMCIKNEHFSEKIMDKALSEIKQSRFLVVDLTGARNSVFFEAGVAHGLDIDIIYVYKEGTEKDNPPLDFYVKHFQCHKYKDTVELKEVLKNAIGARI